MVPNALAIILNLGAVLMLLNILESSNIRRTFLAGLLLGCSLITNSGVAPFIIMAAFWVVFILRKSKKSALAHASVIFIGVALPLLLISFKHFAAEGSFDSFGAHGGINFYVGNNPGANGTFKPPMGFTPSAEGLSEDSAKYAESVYGRRLSAAAVSGFWYNKAFSYITAHPFRWSNLVLRKFVLFWNKTELGDVADYYLIKNDLFLLKFNPFVFGLIAPLGMLGMFLARRDMRKAFLLYAGVASFLFSCLLFFVNSRYRLSAVPFLIIFAGFAVWAVCQQVLQKNGFRRVALYAAFLLVFLAFSNVTVISADTCTPLYNLSVIYARRGMYDEAIGVSKKLLKQGWSMPMVHFNLGVCFYGKKMHKEAAVEFNEAVRLNPKDYDSHFNLGLIYYEQKDIKKAFKEFEASLRGSDKDLASHYWLGKIHEEQGHYKAAKEEYMAALKINPEVVQLKKAMEHIAKKQGI
jgi:tetratricopeptide (TPR) repeat protein